MEEVEQHSGDHATWLSHLLLQNDRLMIPDTHLQFYRGSWDLWSPAIPCYPQPQNSGAGSPCVLFCSKLFCVTYQSLPACVPPLGKLRWCDFNASLSSSSSLTVSTHVSTMPLCFIQHIYIIEFVLMSRTRIWPWNTWLRNFVACAVPKKTQLPGNLEPVLPSTSTWLCWLRFMMRLPLGNLQWHVLVVSHIVLAVFNSEHTHFHHSTL